MKKLISSVVALVSMVALAQEVPTEPNAQASASVKKVAIFVQNRTRVPGMDDEIDGIRDRLAASLAAVEGIEVCDSAQIADTFRRYKVTTEEEKRELYTGIFSGGSAPNIAKMIGCDYIIAASVIGASSMNRTLEGQRNTVFTLRMTTKIMDATGRSVGAVPNWTNTFPVLDEPGDDPMNYYNILFDRWVGDVTEDVANNATRWRAPTANNAALVSVQITTSIDRVVTEIESQTKGIKGELLAELRKVVGGATIEVDGAVIGTAPGVFKVASGLHQLKVSRQWMQSYTATVNFQEGTSLDIALELSDAGLAKWGTAEALRADVAKRYSDAAFQRGVKVNVDTTNWRDVSSGTLPRTIKLTD